jgi:hypothetical protein
MSDIESQTLADVNVAVFIAPKGTEEAEFTEPKQTLSNAVQPSTLSESIPAKPKL